MPSCTVAARASTIPMSPKVWGLTSADAEPSARPTATEDPNLNLRLLALARGAHDVRSLDAGWPGWLPVAV